MCRGILYKCVSVCGGGGRVLYECVYKRGEASRMYVLYECVCVGGGGGGAVRVCVYVGGGG